MNIKKMFIVLAGLMIVLISLINLYACSQQSSNGTTTTTSYSTTTTSASTHPLVGTWVGTWEDSYAITGSLEATISQTGNTLNGTGYIGLAGLNPQGFHFSTEAGTATGTISGSSVTFTFNSSPVGFGSGVVIGNTISGSGDVTAFADGGFTFIGTIEAGGRRINALFDFTSPSAGDGGAVVIKQ